MVSESISVPQNAGTSETSTNGEHAGLAKDPASGPSKSRQRASKACASCNRRKTKCDVAQTGLPCTKCSSVGRECSLSPTKRGKYDRSRLYPERSVTPGISASATSPPIMDAQPCQASTTRNRAGSLAGTTLTNTTLTNTHPTYISPPPVNPNPATGAYAAQEAPFGQVSPSLGIQLRHQSPAALAGMQSLQGVTNQYHFYAPMPSQPALPVLAAPSSSVLHGSPSCAGAALSAPTDDLSFAFDFGDTVLPEIQSQRIHTPNRLQDQNTDYAAPENGNNDSSAWTDLMALPLERLDDAHTSQDVMYAGDLFTLSHLLREHWKAQGNAKVSQNRLHFPSVAPETSELSGIAQDQQHVQLQYLAQIGCFTLPPKNVLDRMISAYFNYFHPVYPILSRARFYQQYGTVLSGGVPMLLLWGMLYVSTTLCSLDDLKSAGFRTRFEALRSFCIRGKALYNASYERDKANVVIFEFLLSQIWSEGEDSFLWSGRAATTAQSMGMHRTTANSKLVDEDRRLWRRVWWSIFIRDRHAAAASGRPYRINEEFNDIELPEREDFDSEDTYLRFYYSVKLAKLVSKVVECKLVVNREYEDIQRAICYEGFTEWMSSLPRQLSAAHAATDIFIAFLHISYHCWVIHLFRPASDEEANSAIASQSAAAATRLFEDLLQQGRVGQGPQFTVTCLFAAMAQHVVDRRCSTGTIQTLSTHRLAVCKLASKELAAMRPVAAWFRRMFRSLDARNPDDEKSPTLAPTKAPDFFTVPYNEALREQAPFAGSIDAIPPSSMFSDLFWGLPSENPDDKAIDWLFDNS